MRLKSSCAILAGLLLVSSPVLAQDRNDAPTPESEAMAGIERLLRALELFMESIPQFEAPTMNEDGDIIIRRKRPPEDDAPEETPEGVPGEEDDATSTAT
jgi:hypothetical protein